MVIKKGIIKEVLLYLFRNPSTNHTISSLTEELNRSRVGVWKTVKALEKENFLILKPIDLIKKNIYLVSLNWDNILLEKSLEILLVDESLKFKNWMNNFKNISSVLEFLILCRGKNKDKLVGITQKGKFIRIQKPVNLGELNTNEIEALSLTNYDFLRGLKNNNEEHIDTVKTGVILFGQENFIQFIKTIHLTSPL